MLALRDSVRVGASASLRLDLDPGDPSPRRSFNFERLSLQEWRNGRRVVDDCPKTSFN
jgi:hypothetical protein